MARRRDRGAGGRALGTTPLRRVGQPPKRLLVYQAEAGRSRKAQTPELLKGDLKAKVEVLGHGQQSVAFGVHPVTGLPFAWNGPTPETMPLDELPAVTQEQVEPFVAEAEHRYGRPATGPRPRSRPPRRRPEPEPQTGRTQAQRQRRAGDASPFKAVNDEAMRRLEAWVRELFPTAKQQAGTGAWRVPSRDLGRQLEEDLSIAPSGIVDFGIHDQGDPREGRRTPIDLVMEYGGAPDATQAARWLADRLGMTLEIGRRRRQPGSGTAQDARETGDAVPKASAPKPAPAPTSASRPSTGTGCWASAPPSCATCSTCAAPCRSCWRGPWRPAARKAEDRDGAAVDLNGVRHRPGSLLFMEAAPGRVAWYLDEHATFWRYVRREKEWVPQHCPKEVAASIVDAAIYLDFRPCAGIAHVPLLVGDRLVTKPGYHAPTGLILDLRGAPIGRSRGARQGRGRRGAGAAAAALPGLPRRQGRRPRGRRRGGAHGGPAALPADRARPS